jgi:hypothetical protein
VQLSSIVEFSSFDERFIGSSSFSSRYLFF